MKDVTKTIENEVKGQRSGFCEGFLGTLGPSLLGNMLTGNDVICGGDGVMWAGDWVIWTGGGKIRHDF